MAVREDSDRTRLIDWQQVLFDQMMKISALSTVIYDNTGVGLQTNIRNYISGVENLESMAVRYLDASYWDRKRLLIAHHLKRFHERDMLGFVDDGSEQLKYGRTLYSMIIASLDAKGALTDKFFVEKDVDTEE